MSKKILTITYSSKEEHHSTSNQNTRADQVWEEHDNSKTGKDNKCYCICL